MDLEKFNLNELLTIVFRWSYKNNRRLYQNLDDVFSVTSYRSHSEKLNVLPFEMDFDKSFEILKYAITLCDYHDTLKFSWTFIGCGRNRTDEYHYDGCKTHEYSGLIPFINKHFKKLESENMADLHKSKDVKKHEHFRYWMNKFLTDDNEYYSLKLLYQIQGNLNAHQILNISDSKSESFKPIFKFILDEFIIPNPHYKEIVVHGDINPDYDNPIILKKSGKILGLWYLVYLTAEELMKIYKTLIHRKLNGWENANWNFIKSVFKHNKEDKFYIFIT